MQPKPENNYGFYYNQTNPNTLVMLRKIEYLRFLQKQNKRNEKDQILPNYYFLHRPKKALLQKITLKAMISHQTDRKIMVKLFCDLARRYFTNEIDEFQLFYIDNDTVDENHILKQYTKEGFFYCMLNKVLRGAKDPLQIFYVQYFTQMLHKTIKQIYSREKGQSFTCYRGAYLKQQQIKEAKQNIGSHIQTLGFLSTSLKKQVATKFMTNVLFQIEVEAQQKSQALDFGFVELNHERTQIYEQQILFNALSCFQIVNVSEQVDEGLKYFLIQMKYGISYEIVQKYHRQPRNLSKQEQFVLPLIQKQQQKSVDNQIDAIQQYPDLQVEKIKFYEKALDFWRQQPRSAQQTNNIIKQLFIQRYSAALNIYHENKTQGLSETTINYLNHSYRHNLRNTDVEQTDLSSVGTKIVRWILQIKQMNRRQDYKQSKFLILKCRQQINVLRKLCYQLSVQVKKVGSSQLNSISIILEQLIQQVELLDVQADVEMSYHVDPMTQSQKIKDIKQTILIKYGKHHPKHLQIIMMEFVFKSKTKSYDYRLMEEIWENVTLTGMSDSSFLSSFQKTNSKVQQLISQGRYQDAVIQISKYKENISKKLLKKKQLQLNMEMLMDPIFEQLHRLRMNLEIKKISHLEQICSQIDYQQVPLFWDSQLLLKLQMQYKFPGFIQIMQQVLLFLKTNPPQISINKFNQVCSSLSSNNLHNSFMSWFLKCLKVSALKLAGRYAEANNLKEQVLCVVQKSQYLDIFQQHFEKDDSYKHYRN